MAGSATQLQRARQQILDTVRPEASPLARKPVSGPQGASR